MKRWILMCFFPLCLLSGTWDPIPPETWSIKPDSVNGAGAIYLLDWSRYGVRDTEYRMRILIMTEAGKAAVRLDPFSKYLSKVEGRTVYPDGRVVEFNKTQDFADQVVERGFDDVKRKVLVPPGLTGHCVVDLHWIDDGTVLHGNHFEQPIQRPYPIQLLELRVPIASPMGSVWLKPKSMAMESTNDGEYFVYRIRDLPALEPSPYSREAWRIQPKFLCFFQPRALRPFLGSNAKYWDATAKQIMKADLDEHLTTGGSYRSLKLEIFTGLPTDSLEKGRVILERLRAKVLNTGYLTAAEKAARSKSDETSEINPRDLDESAKRRWTNASGMFYLAFRLLYDAGLAPKVVMAADRDKRGFRFELPDYYQFDQWLVAITDESGKLTVLSQPNVRTLPLGVISSSYQGTDALMIDSKDWTAHSFSIPFQSSSLNKKSYAFEITLGEDENRFSIHESSEGLEAWYERRGYFDLTGQEAAERLKDGLQKTRSVTITHASIPDWATPSPFSSWDAEGTFEVEDGRRKSVDPFPTLACPLWVPDSWPQHRVDPVVLYYPSSFESTSRIQVPEGWKPILQEAIERNNRFGKLSWQARESHVQGASLVEVTYSVQVTRTLGDANSEGDLRNLLSWVQEARNRRITLEKTR